MGLTAALSPYASTSPSQVVFLGSVGAPVGEVVGLSEGFAVGEVLGEEVGAAVVG
jgi:hypothetical protein